METGNSVSKNQSPVLPIITDHECLEHFQGFIKSEKPGLSVFYDDTDLAAKASIGAAMATKLIENGCTKKIAKDLAVLTLYDLVMLIDDSDSMKYEEEGSRIKTLEATLKAIAEIYELSNSQGIVSVQFLNVPRNENNVSSENAKNVVKNHYYGGVTRIGINLKRKILDKFVSEDMRKPLLVITITDGVVEGERKGLLEAVIIHAVPRLMKHPTLEQDAVSFQFARVGKDNAAAEMLEKLSDHQVVGRYVSCLPVTDPLENISDSEHKWNVLRKLLVGAIVQDWNWSEFDRYKLETSFFPNDTVAHTTYKMNHSTRERVAVRTVWADKMQIGSGGYGSVWLQKEANGQFRAIKRLFIRPGIDYSMELKALSILSNQRNQFVQFLGWYKLRDQLFIAMEFIQHGDLSQYIRSGGSHARANARDIVKQVLTGLVILHEKRICHRDLKPQNILIASLDPISVKIADFGASIYLNDALQHSRMGTPGYLAPEILGLLRRNTYSLAIDMWALGCITYEMMTLEPPFAALTTAQFTTLMSGLATETTPLFPQTDISLLKSFCVGQIPFPVQSLRSSGASDDVAAFIQDLLVADPSSRLTASAALQTPWILGTENEISTMDSSLTDQSFITP